MKKPGKSIFKESAACSSVIKRFENSSENADDLFQADVSD